VTAWELDDEDTIIALSTPDAMRMVQELPTPVGAEFSSVNGVVIDGGLPVDEIAIVLRVEDRLVDVFAGESLDHLE
jgi:hypothetical protein